jgi:hypothetical protein
MTTDSFVSITCPACGVTGTVPVDALLVSLAVGDDRAATSLLEPDMDAGVDNAATVAWACGGCADLTTGQLDWPALLTLVTAGATVLDDATDEARPPHPEQRTAGAPLTRDDLLALHELLASGTWFDQVPNPGRVKP